MRNVLELSVDGLRVRLGVVRVTDNPVEAVVATVHEFADLADDLDASGLLHRGYELANAVFGPFGPPFGPPPPEAARPDPETVDATDHDTASASASDLP
ncbi:MAG: hypothetical protein H6736_17150 [Alphaproteobacteria bacterium]|nr:hypothetical protein [Alphaproteobacteria bacterium]